MSGMLFDKNYEPRRGDPPDLMAGDEQPEEPVNTSAAAYEAILPRKGTLQGRILEYLEGRGFQGATDEKMQQDLEMNPSTQRPRRGELVAKGLVVDSGRRSELRTGRKAIVWVAKGDRHEAVKTG